MDQLKLNKWSWREVRENKGEQVSIGILRLPFWLDEKEWEIFMQIMLGVTFHTRKKNRSKTSFQWNYGKGKVKAFW